MKTSIKELDEGCRTVVLSDTNITEEDKPFGQTALEVKIPEHTVDELENKMKVVRGLHEIKLKDQAFKFMVICMIILIIIYGLDLIFINFNVKNSTYATGIFELIKFILSALIGYLFSRKIQE